MGAGEEMDEAVRSGCGNMVKRVMFYCGGWKEGSDDYC